MRILILSLIFLSLKTIAMHQVPQPGTFIIDGKPLYLAVYRASPTETNVHMQYVNFSVIQNHLTQTNGKVLITYRGTVEINLGYDESMHPTAAEKTFNSLMKKITPAKNKQDVPDQRT